MANMIEVKNLVKRFGKFTAVDDISFEIGQGEIFGFLGPNGAGKTTTINILTTFLKPSSGSALVADFDVVKQKRDVRRSIGRLFQEGSLDGSLTAFENLEFHGILYGVPRRARRDRTKDLIEVVGLAEWRGALVRTFSGGMKRRLEIARELVHRPRILFFDEPTLGLDVQTRILIWDYIRRLATQEDITIFMTTHYMEEAEYTDRVAIIDHGKIIALDTPVNLKKIVGKDTVVLVSENNNEAREFIARTWGITPSERDNTLCFEVPDGQQFIPVLIKNLPLQVDAISTRRPTLEDVFVRLTGREIRENNSGGGP